MEAGPRVAGSESPRRILQYELLESLGRGGMGEVFLARDTRLDRRVAIKAIHPSRLYSEDAKARFLREAEIASSLVHPYVATVFDVLEHDQQTFLVMEYIEGRPLRDAIRGDDILFDDRLRLGGEIAEALSAIHDRGLIHRDLKPSNVMLTPSGHAKVLDFGLARKALVTEPVDEAIDDRETRSAPLTAPGAALGTIAYMSPEQLRGEPLDRRSDIFSLGTLLYELTTGVHPFLRATEIGTASAILNEPPGETAEPRTLSGHPTLKQVLSHALEKERDDRYQSAQELTDDLERLRRGEVARAGLAALARRRRVRLWVSSVFACLAIAIVAWGYWLINTPPSWDDPRFSIAIEAFDDRSGLEDGERTAEMLTHLLALDLEGSRLVRVVAPQRSSALLAGVGPSLRGDVDYVLRGVLYSEQQELLAIVEAAPGSGRPGLPPVRARGALATELAEALGASLRRSLPDVPMIAALRDDGTEVGDITSSSEDAISLYRAGLVYGSEHRFDEAVSRFEAATEIDPAFAMAHLAMAEVLYSAGDHRRARESAARARELDPGLGSPARERLARRIRAVWAITHGRTEQAVEESAELARQYPDESEFVALQAFALGLKSRFDEALSAIDRAIELNPADAALYLQKGELLTRAGRAAQALAPLDRAAEIYARVESLAGRAATAVARADALVGASRLGSAGELLSDSGKLIDSAGSEFLSARAALLRATIALTAGRAGAVDESLAVAEEVAERTGNLPLQAEALTLRGARLFYASDFAGASEMFREAADIGRRHDNEFLLIDPLQNLAPLLAYEGRLDEARAVLEELVRAARFTGRDDREITAKLTLADVEYQSGDVQAGIDTYREVAERENEGSFNRSWAELGLAEVFERQGRLGPARDAAAASAEGFARLGQEGYEALAMTRHAQVSAALGRFEEARESLERARAIAAGAGGFEDLRVRLALAEGIAEMLQGDADDALVAAGRGLALPAATTPTLAVPLKVLRCEALSALARHEEATTSCRGALAVELAPVPELTLARVALGRALLAAGERREALVATRRALDAASGQGLILGVASSAATLAESTEAEGRTDEDSERLATGVEAFRAFLAAVPDEDLQAVRARPSVAWIESALKRAE